MKKVTVIKYIALQIYTIQRIKVEGGKMLSALIKVKNKE